jgi:hypothetical protein
MDPNRRVVFEYHAEGIQAFIGNNLLGDNQAGVVIQADTYHPYRLFIVSTGAQPRLIRTIENGYGFGLQDDCDGRTRLWTSDGAFQNDPDMKNVYHRDLFVPDVVFGLQGGELFDATQNCKAYFDEHVAFCRESLTKSDLQRFRTQQIKDEFHRGQVRGYILKIVYSLLYTGRTAEAKQALNEMWPPNDKDRVWHNIEMERSQGVLAQVGNPPHHQ